MVKNKTNKTKIVTIGGFQITLTNLDKILFPKDGIIKQEIVDYYDSIASTMMPYIKNRPISMLRYPNGINAEGFYQKNAGEYFPKWITRKPIRAEEGKLVKYVVVDKKATLVYLANQLCLTPHIWLSKIDALNYPDRMIFDLDPSGQKFDFNFIRKTAIAFKELLEEIGLVPFIMTTGSRGMHVVVPLDRKQPFEYVRSFAHDIALFMQKHDSKNLTLEMRKSKRGKKIFLDYLRNSYTATSVAPYAIRAKDGAPVATPIDWDEVNDPKLVSTRYTYKTVFKRLEKKGDPWKTINKSARSLIKAQKNFLELIKK
jgi:bifunctional non-homologous end joining protein LigD